MTDSIDNKLDYVALYGRYVNKIKRSGDQCTGLCPVKPEHNASFSFDAKTGKCRCFSCGFEGNFFSLRAAVEHIDTKEAFKRTCKECHIENDKQPSAQTQVKKEPEQAKPTPYTLDDYAAEKRLPKAWLEDFLKLTEGRTRYGGFVRIPYFDTDGTISCTRQRNHPNASPRFTWTKGSSIIPYGLQFLRDKPDKLILVEGESDAQTLWFMGFDALGIPGASTFKAAHAGPLMGVPALYIHVEPDNGGQTFIAKVREQLKAAGYAGEVFRFSCSDKGVKDPSALFIRDGDKAHGEIEALLAGAKRESLEEHEHIAESITGAPINLRIPDGYAVADDGIITEDPKTRGPMIVIKTPLLITKRLVSIATGEEKVEVLFKRDGRFIGGTFARTTIFSNAGILELASLGAIISSDNASRVVRYLTKLEAENLDIIPVTKSTSTLGWLPSNKFLPWHADGIELDAHGSLAQWANSCVKRGTLQGWVDTMRTARDNSHRFRFILAGSFTAPLLKLIKCRSFLIYNWADSRGGKTATLKAALSAWGDPEKMMVTFNSTKVALERMASFFCDIPLGIDERQLAGNSQESIETIFYMLSNGVSRGRGTKDGGIQEISTWRTVALTTGEEPVQNDTTMSGVATRTIEVVGAPFSTEKDAAEMHRRAGENTGVAGDAFIKYILEQGEDAIFAIYSSFVTDIEKRTADRNGAQLASLAAVATADEIVSEVLFAEDHEKAHKKSLNMISAIIEGLREEELPDVNVSASQFISSWIVSNFEKGFAEDAQTRLGWAESGITDGGSVYILPPILKSALEDAGYSYRKTRKYLQDMGVIFCKDGTMVKKYDNRSVRVIPVDFDKLSLIGTKHEDEELPPF